MKIYLLDDDISIVQSLKALIEDRNLGTICGTSLDAEDALDDLSGYVEPDILIVDLLMPKIDGITFVKKISKQHPNLAVIMLSQVSAKNMIARAYEAGVEFYINKPLNFVEVESVITKVEKELSMRNTLRQMQQLISGGAELPDMREGQGLGNPGASKPAQSAGPDRLAGARSILQQLGILGEAGSQELLQILEYLLDHPDELSKFSVKDLCSMIGDKPKVVEQRIRRAAFKGMRTLAALGNDDFSNELFLEYAHTLYEYDQVCQEMNCLKGKSDLHGYVKTRKFIYELACHCM